MKLNVIELAKQAGLEDWTDDGNWRGVDDDLVRFANAVLEEAAKKAARMVNGKSIAAAIREMKS